MNIRKLKKIIKNLIYRLKSASISNKSGQYENVHIMHNDKFNKSLVDFYNRCFGADKNLFIFFGGCPQNQFEIPKYDNVLVINNIKSLKLSNKVKRIILHGLFMIEIINWLFQNKNLLSKCYWIIWGGDLYNCNETPESMYVKQNLKAYLCTQEKDAEYAKKKYDSDSTHIQIDIPSPLTLEMLDNAKIDKSTRDYKVIQVEHSANQSIPEILDKLSRFKNEPVKIKTVLSYGDTSYNEEIINKGKNIFEDKFTAITEYLSPEEHAKLLADADILIMNQKRPQGSRNINALMYLGAKIYLRSDVSTWDYLQEENFKVFDTLNIDNESYESFISFDEQDRIYNQKLGHRLHTDEYIKEFWEKIFNS